jgi:hypothetical protein
MRKFPKLKYPNDPETDGVLADDVVVTEKLDGGNFRFSWDDGLMIGTRNHVYEADDENIPKAFRHAVEYVQDCLAEANNQFLAAFHSGEWTLFGEAMHYHSLRYQKGSPHFGEGYPSVVLFDIYDEDAGEWLPWNEVENVVTRSPFTLTEVLAEGDGQELKDGGALAIPEESMFGGNPEGIVVRRKDGIVRAKKVSEDFKEQNAQAFNDPSRADGDAAQFVAGFVTDARIEKEANKLVDEGRYDRLEMAMMEDLPRRVLVDAVGENAWSELLTSGGFEAEWDDDFKAEVRSKASKKCARVLKTLCQEF